MKQITDTELSRRTDVELAVLFQMAAEARMIWSRLASGGNSDGSPLR